MNQPVQTTAAGINTQVVSAVKCALIYATVVNGGSTARVYALFDAASTPPLSGFPPTAILSPPIAAGATWRFSPLDSCTALPFTNGVVFRSYGVDALGNTIFTALSPADATLNAWSALLA